MISGSSAAQPVLSQDSSERFDALYQRLQPSLWRYAHRMVGDSDTADDVVQEAFVRLLRRPDLEGEDARLWLFTVTTNLIRDRGRTTTRRRRILEEGKLDVPRPTAEAVSLERDQKIAAVRAALEQLPERDQQMLLMREEGFRYHEIAAAAGVAPGSVGTLIARAVKRFTQVYSQIEG